MIQVMNNFLADWKRRFFLSESPLTLVFSEDDSGCLCFNARPLCQVSDWHLETARYDVSAIVFYFNEGRMLTLNVVWPEDEIPHVGSVVVEFLLNMDD